jgi:hypothetical protein
MAELRRTRRQIREALAACDAGRCHFATIAGPVEAATH